jgi:hypothetical protein
MAYSYPGRLNRRKRDDRVVVFGLIALALIIIGLGIKGCAGYYDDSPITLKVTGKESVNTTDGHEYRVYSDNEVYVMGDSLLKGRFRTANDYARLQIGQTYTCTSWGWRIPITSSFKNIRDCRLR